MTLQVEQRPAPLRLILGQFPSFLALQQEGRVSPGVFSRRPNCVLKTQAAQVNVFEIQVISVCDKI